MVLGSDTTPSSANVSFLMDRQGAVPEAMAKNCPCCRLSSAGHGGTSAHESSTYLWILASHSGYLKTGHSLGQPIPLRAITFIARDTDLSSHLQVLGNLPTVQWRMQFFNNSCYPFRAWILLLSTHNAHCFPINDRLTLFPETSA